MPRMLLNTSLTIIFTPVINYTAKACFPLSFEAIGSWLWEKTLVEPAFVPVLLALSATHRTASLHLVGAPQKMIVDCARDSLRLRSQSIKALQRLLGNPAGVDYETAIVFVNQLLASEVGRGALLVDEKHKLMGWAANRCK